MAGSDAGAAVNKTALWVGGAVLALLVLVGLRRRGGGPTLLQADTSGVDQVQIARYQAGGSAIGALAQAYSAQTVAQAQANADVQVANAAALATKYQADAQVRAAQAQSSSSIWGDLFDAVTAIGVAAIG